MSPPPKHIDVSTLEFEALLQRLAQQKLEPDDYKLLMQIVQAMGWMSHSAKVMAAMVPMRIPVQSGSQLSMTSINREIPVRNVLTVDYTSFPIRELSFE